MLKVKALLTATRVAIEIRNRFFKRSILSVGFYESETWTIKKKEERYLESFVMWLWKRVITVKRTKIVRKDELLMRIREE